jgi:flavin reductase (DIM6/NTAB) family NADH-FMN oxidoreductase RutF
MPSTAGPVDAGEFAAALRQYPAGVCLLTVRDDIDDVGTTVSAVMSLSAVPPLVAVGLAADGYPAELLGEVGRCALTVLAAEHAIVASRFSSAGRPSARHLLESVPWTRAEHSGAIVLSGGLAALDCRVERLMAAGDHVLAVLEVVGVPVLADDAAPPLLRLRGRYVDESGGAAGRG